MATRVSAAFPDRGKAQEAVTWLRGHGVPNERIAVLARHEDELPRGGVHADAQHIAADPGSDLGRGAGTGLAVGAGVGAVFGLAAALIPGIGPFITAGALANLLGVTGGAAAAGAIVGGTSGALAGALSKWGLDQADADYYAKEVEGGGVFVTATLEGAAPTAAEVETAFRRCGGQSRSM